MLDICKKYSINEEEYLELEQRFGKLCWKAAHLLKKKNFNNNFTDDPEDIKQTLIIDMMRAGSYTKRQVYIEKCLAVAKKYATDDFIMQILVELATLWKDRKRHGANRQKFGPHQEQLLDNIVKQIVPKEERPDQKAPLVFTAKFAGYCKAIVWNGEKSMGKKITREKNIRNGLVSLSEYDYLGGSV